MRVLRRCDIQLICIICSLLGLVDSAVVQARPGRSRAVSPAAGAAAILDSAMRKSNHSAPRWQVYDTDNFRVLHMNLALAKRVADVAERERDVLRRVWTGKEDVLRWTTRCPIYLYPSHEQMVLMTGGEHKAGSAQVRPSKLYRGRILSRRVDLTADDPHLLDSTVPHEVSHLIYGDVFGGKIPLWANEGAATMAESSLKQRYYSRVLRRFLRTGQLFELSVLFKMQRYPDFPYQTLFYAQSSSLVSYMLSLADGPAFIRFLGMAQKRGYSVALHEVYGMNNPTVLYQRWLRSLNTVAAP